MQKQNANPLLTPTSHPISLNPTKLSIEELISDIEYPTTTLPVTIFPTQNALAPIRNHLTPKIKESNKTPHTTCICNHSGFACPLIKCICCQQSHHPICHGFFSPTDIRCKDFVCSDCSKQQMISFIHSVQIIRMRKLIYFVYQMNKSVKSTEIMKGCMMTNHVCSSTIAILNKKVNLTDLFEVSKKGNTKFFKSKDDEKSKKILMEVFNGTINILEDTKK